MTDYFCCGVTNPWDDIFGETATHQVPQDQNKTDWNNPFAAAPQVSPETRSEQYDSRSVGGYSTDARSIGTFNSGHADTVTSVGSGTAGTVTSVGSGTADTVTSVGSGTAGTVTSVGSATYRKVAPPKKTSSSMVGKSLRDIEREEKARKRALKMSEGLMVLNKSNDGPSRGAMILTQGSTFDSSPATFKSEEKALAKKVDRILSQKTQVEVARTETSRKNRERTAEDVRDPETVRGMKAPIDIYNEKMAKKQSALMISSGKFPYNENAGIAIWTEQEARRNKKTKHHVIYELV
eukprot:831646_1